MVQLDIEPVAGALGAEVRGVDLASDLTPDLVAAIRSAFVEHQVLFFRDQQLDAEQQMAFGRSFGELDEHPFVHGTDHHPEVLEIITMPDDVVNFGGGWHTDVTFMERPPMGSILRPVVLPPHGGDTNWADSQLAYESLSAPVRRMIDGLTAMHDGNREFGYYLAQKRGGKGNVWDGAEVTALVPVEHPVVRVHPETGRKGLFVNPGFTSHIVGVSEAESRGILDLLYAHLTKPEHIVRHRWRLGDLVLWDNRALLHVAHTDYDPSEGRILHRMCLEGDVPF